MTTNLETQLTPLATALRSGRLSLETYLEQLEIFFEAEDSRIQSFLPEKGRFERLSREAAALQIKYPAPQRRPLLYGVPVGVKDIFHVDGLPTQAGSQLPDHVLAGSEAKSVTTLKEQGALILGKTVTTEFAYFANGPTRNPHNVEHTPGGSSSGSAAAVAAKLCPLTLGTQTIGSVVRPASFCGVVGFKPSSERISRQGVIPLSPTLDHVGFFTEDVAGAILAASVLCRNWHGILKQDEKPTLGIPTGPYLEKVSPEGLAHFQLVVKKLEEAGYTIVSVEAMPDFEEINTAHQALVAAEAAAVHADWFAEFGDRYHPKTVELIERGQQVSAGQVAQARTGRKRLREDLTSLMREHLINIWISPSAVGTAPSGLESTGDPIMNLPWTYAGVPALNLPSGFDKKGLPFGLQLAGLWQEDEQLLAWAESLVAVLH